MTDTLNDVLNNPAIKTGLELLMASRPELGLALSVATTLLNGWNEQAQTNTAIKTIDVRAAEHIKRLATQKLRPTEQNEIEIRLHELLTILIKLGRV